jgi:hypothetical protein
MIKCFTFKRSWLSLVYFQAVLWIRIRMNPHHFGELDPDPHHSEKQDPDEDPHLNKMMEALEGYFGALEGPNLEKSDW